LEGGGGGEENEKTEKLAMAFSNKIEICDMILLYYHKFNISICIHTIQFLSYSNFGEEKMNCCILSI
jgi:sulfur relay (sulfurtransferase) DsrC/TusE family protein